MKLALKTWRFVAYPLVVGAFILVSANYLLGSQERWVQIAQGEQIASEQEARAAELRDRLEAVESVQPERERVDLELMAKAVLPTKAIWVMVAQLKDSIEVSGAQLVRYQAGKLGDVKEASASAALVEGENEMTIEVTANVADLGVVTRLIHSLENKLPLMKITKLNYQRGNVVFTVMGAWEPWSGGAVGESVKDYRVVTDEVKAMIGGFEEYDTVGLSATDSGTTLFSPF